MAKTGLLEREWGKGSAVAPASRRENKNRRRRYKTEFFGEPD